MSGFLLDTNCISEVVRGKPETRVMEWIEAANERLLYLSVLTLGEIRKGVAGLPQGTRRTQLETWLEIDLQARFAGRTLAIDAAIVDRWGQLAAKQNKREERYRRSTDCLPRLQSTTILRLCRAMSATSPTLTYPF